jgi:hypothetical protein
MSSSAYLNLHLIDLHYPAFNRYSSISQFRLNLNSALLLRYQQNLILSSALHSFSFAHSIAVSSELLHLDVPTSSSMEGKEERKG